MTYSPVTRFLALSLVAAVLMPSVFFMTTPKAHAVIPVTVDFTPTLQPALKSAIENTFTAVKSAITAVATVANKIASYMLVVDKYVLEPIAFIESGQLLKAITAGVVQFVDGAANGTGIPQFVQDISGNLQAVADTQAFSFFSQFSSLSNSPFSSSIVSSLRTQYLQGSTLGGFFAANQCTLSQVSSNITGYLNGNWSQGGVAAWFALTTQPQNNPYMLFMNARAEGNALMTNAVNNAFAQLNWGNGFLSWCGSTNTIGGGVANPTTDACTQSNGTPGVIKTPGSVIKDALNKALGVNIDKLIQMGQVGPEVNAILGDVATVMNTLSFGQQLLGGVNSGGLAGLTSGGSESTLNQYQNQAGYLGVTNSTVLNTSAATSVGTDLASRVTQYQTAWNTIAAATNNASSTLQKLITACSASTTVGMQMPSTAQTTLIEAQGALSSEVAPVAQQIAQANAVIASAQAFQAQIAADANAGNTAAYASDLALSQTTAPTETDIANVQQQAMSFGNAQASGSSPLSVTASSQLDQMNLIASNAAGLFSSCAPVPAGTTGYGGYTNYGGGGQ